MRKTLSRREFLAAASFLGLRRLAPAWAVQNTGRYTEIAQSEVDLIVREEQIGIAGGRGTAITVNGSVPGPLLRFREGDTVTIRTTNLVPGMHGSIHWHGVLVPWNMDGVPGVSFDGIPSGRTFTYRFKLRQSGTYWYHSHSGLQEQAGLYGPLLIEPVEPEPYRYDRDYVVLLSDWTFEDPERVLANIKKLPTYYNFQQRTIGDFFSDVSKHGLGTTLRDRLMWGRMRMSATDILDVTGAAYTYLINGLSPQANWTGLFSPGERVRLRFINAGAMTIFDVRIPGLPMTVIHADGQDVAPVETDEFRMGAAETLDVIVQPEDDKAYTIFAEAMDRSGFAAGTLAPRSGMRGTLPERRKRPLRTMKDMGMAHAGDHAAQHPPGHAPAPAPRAPRRDQAGHAPAPAHEAHASHSALPEPVMHGPDHHGPGNAMIAEMPAPRVHEPGTGLEGMPWRVLVYSDLKRLKPDNAPLQPEHEIELHLTGNMERQMWSINGKKYSEDPAPIPIRLDRRTRFVLVNDTMMDHPMHIHGMWMILENGHGAHRPYKHTILVKAGERLAFDVKPDEYGPFAFHCHLLFHMELGMFRVVRVAGGAPPEHQH